MQNVSTLNSYLLKMKAIQCNVYNIILTFTQPFQHEEPYEEQCPYDYAGEYEATYANM